MDPSINHRLIHVIYNCEGPRTIQIVTFCSYVLIYRLLLKFLINTREKQELPRVQPGNSGLLDFDCPNAIDPKL